MRLCKLIVCTSFFHLFSIKFFNSSYSGRSSKSSSFIVANLITCLANDYGFENWIKKSIEFYGDKGDCLIIISSSGQSQNIINACIQAKKSKFNSIITLTGFKKNNPVKKLGKINLWINSKSYNYVENIHQILLLSIVDSLKL